MTGLSGSGKSTIAIETQLKLFSFGYNCYILDGDTLRRGLNRDLSFSAEDRKENIRRAAEVAYLFYKAGFIVLCSFISPFSEDRDIARTLFPGDRFFEVYIKCSIEECIKRDPKNLYKKAINNSIGQFTGISSPYEIPENSELVIDSEKLSADQSSDLVLNLLKSNYIYY